jgi:flagellar assembly factor FliW
MLAVEPAGSISTVALHARIGKMPGSMKQAISEESVEAAPKAPLTIESRFGVVEVDPSSAIVFENGLLGVPKSRLFAMTDFPSPKLGQFKLLQSLEEKELSFITLPLMLDNSLIERADLEKAAADVSFDAASMTIFLIVSVHRSPTETKLSVNARAPLLINPETRSAMQFVFQHSRYKVQHLLDTPGM